MRYHIQVRWDPTGTDMDSSLGISEQCLSFRLMPVITRISLKQQCVVVIPKVVSDTHRIYLQRQIGTIPKAVIDVSPCSIVTFSWLYPNSETPTEVENRKMLL